VNHSDSITPPAVASRSATRRDYRDATIESLFEELEAAKALIAALTDSCDVYRVMTVEACARLTEYHNKQQRLEARLDALRDELRRFTASQIGSAGHMELAA
jgi:hypothetical protein